MAAAPCLASTQRPAWRTQQRCRGTGPDRCTIRYPDGTRIHRDTHGADVVQEHYNTIVVEHITKNHALTQNLPTS